MDPGKQGGYFSTFSIADPDGSTREGLGRTQRRNRRVFVCIPCHRRKLKCDKAQPCSRCVASGTPNECVYQQVPGQKQEQALERDGTPKPEAQSTRQATPDPARSATRPSRLDGPTHWRGVAREVCKTERSILPQALSCCGPIPCGPICGRRFLNFESIAERGRGCRSKLTGNM